MTRNESNLCEICGQTPPTGIDAQTRAAVCRDCGTTISREDRNLIQRLVDTEQGLQRITREINPKVCGRYGCRSRDDVKIVDGIAVCKGCRTTRNGGIRSGSD